MSYTNSNIAKFNKTNKVSYDEAQERISKGRKLNKTKKQNNKRDLWNDEE